MRIRDLIYDVPPSEVSGVFEAWLDNAADDPMLGYTRDDFIKQIRMEHSTYRWLFEPVVEAAGLRIEFVEFDARLYGAYTCIKP